MLNVAPAKCHFMMSVTCKPFMLSVVVLNDVAPNFVPSSVEKEKVSQNLSPVVI